MKPLKTKVSITLDENVIDTIKKMAEKDDRNFSQYINLVLKEWITTHSKETSNCKQYFGERILNLNDTEQYSAISSFLFRRRKFEHIQISEIRYK